MMVFSRIPTLITVSAAAVLGAAAGASLTVVNGLDLSAMISPDVLASSVMTAAALFTVRRWLTGFTERNRLALAELVLQQQNLKDQHAVNMSKVGMANAEAQLQAEAAQGRLAAMNERLDTLAKSRAAEHEELKRLRTEHADLLTEYNALVLESLQAGSNRFTQTGPRAVRHPVVELLPDQRGHARQPGDAPAPQ
ncbi:hypothetical protein [Streptomyces sp. NBC_01207]|uniref:hypothetical protein n=1 Tax=Streptomyces sp. NBC_01207 TaxID=2903772 RepID=UPI002E1593CD|nr:hypothetical protein OG457_27080 [Streptomyces sp. NBC_01207]